MLGLGLGLGRGVGLLRNAASSLFAAYKARVIGAGGTLYNLVCLLNKLNALNTGKYLANLTGILIPSGVREDAVMAQTPNNGDLDIGFTRGSAATYNDASGINRTSPDNLLAQSIWSGVGTNVAPSSWVLYTGAGSSTANISAASTVYNNNQIRCYSVSGGRRYIYQNRTSYQNEVYTISVYVDSVTGSADIAEVLGVSGPALISTSYLEDGVVVPGTNKIAAGKRYSYRFTINATSATLEIRFGGGVANSINAYDFIISRPMVVFGTSSLEYVTTTDRQNYPRVTFANHDYSISTCGRLIGEQSRTNSVRNNQMVGAVAGSPGTLPTNWSTAGGTGLTRTITDIGEENGLRYIDIRYSGTASTTFLLIYFDTGTSGAAVSQSWTHSIFIKRVGGTIPTNNSIGFRELPGVIDGETPITITNTLQRFTYNRTTTGGTTTSLSPYFGSGLTNGASYDFTLRFAVPQLELGAYATSPIRCFTAATTRAVEALWKSDIYSTNIISAGGGVLFLDLRNTVARVRENTNNAIYLSTAQYGVTGNGLAIRNDSTFNARPHIGKYVGGVFTQLFLLASDNNKVMFRWNGTSVDVFVNGVKVVTASSFTATAMENFGFDTVPYPIYIEEIDFGNDPSLWSDANCIAKTT